MHKRLIDENPQLTAAADWLKLDELAEVEISSEDARHPIESALLAGAGSGWRAAVPGKQTIRLLFKMHARQRQARQLGTMTN
jgi:hypothetical protein